MADGNYNGGGQQSTRDYHALGDFRKALTAPPQPTAVKQPRLSVHYHKNKIILEARTNVPADMNTTERGVIRAEMEDTTYFAFLAAFDRIIASREPGTERIRILRPDFRKVNNGNPVLDCTVVFGRDKDGIVFLSLLSWNKERPMIKFPFHPGRFSEFFNNDGTPMSDADLSDRVAAGYLRLWTNLVPHYVYNRYVAESYDKGNKNGGSGGGQSYNGNRNDSQRSGGDMRTESKPDTDDGNWDGIPF